jgi:hypothetical protein
MVEILYIELEDEFFFFSFSSFSTPALFFSGISVPNSLSHAEKSH